MKNTILRTTLLAALALAMVFGLGAQTALADGHEFDVSVYHNINGRALGRLLDVDLSKELPVDIYVYDGDENLLNIIPGFEFKQRIDTTLPAGEYIIKIRSQELGVFVDSMTVGPVDIPGGVEVRMQARLGAGQTPIVAVKVK